MSQVGQAFPPPLGFGYDYDPNFESVCKLTEEGNSIKLYRAMLVPTRSSQPAPFDITHTNNLHLKYGSEGTICSPLGRKILYYELLVVVGCGRERELPTSNTTASRCGSIVPSNLSTLAMLATATSLLLTVSAWHFALLLLLIIICSFKCLIENIIAAYCHSTKLGARLRAHSPSRYRR